MNIGSKEKVLGFCLFCLCLKANSVLFKKSTHLPPKDNVIANCIARNTVLEKYRPNTGGVCHWAWQHSLQAHLECSGCTYQVNRPPQSVLGCHLCYLRHKSTKILLCFSTTAPTGHPVSEQQHACSGGAVGIHWRSDKVIWRTARRMAKVLKATLMMTGNRVILSVKEKP